MSVNEVIGIIVGIFDALGLTPIITGFFALVFAIAAVNYLLGRR